MAKELTKEQKRENIRKSIELFCEKQLEYLFLASLISSDNILTKEDAEESLEAINNVDEVVDSTNIPEEKKAEFHNYCEKGRSILRADIERFEKDEK